MKINIILQVLFMTVSLNILHAQAFLNWQRSFNPAVNNSQSVQDIAVDDIGHSYWLGYTERGYNGTDIALIKYSKDGQLLWGRSFDGGNEFNSDVGKSIVISKTLQGTFIYAGCDLSISGYGKQIALMKYDTSGLLIWSKVLPMGNNSSVTKVLTDESGNIFLGGGNPNGGSGSEMVVIKFNPSGDTLWTKKVPNPTGGFNAVANDIVLDQQGNIYGTGSYYESTSRMDLMTFKISGTGNLIWSKNYNFGFNNDVGNAICYTDDGHVFVTGRSDPSYWQADAVTIKYNTSTGDTVWVKRYSSVTNVYDEGNDIVADDNGNVYVTGQTDGNAQDGDIMTIKYDVSGNFQWMKKYSGTSPFGDVGKKLAIDSLGRVFVAGRVSGGYGAKFVGICYNSSGDSLWTRVYDVGSVEEVYSMTLDKDLNMLIAGECDNTDMAVVKYSATGNLRWARKYYGQKLYADFVNSIATDANGNVYAAGKCRVSQYGDQFTIIKYDKQGNTMWSKRYGVQLFDNFDAAKSIVTDKNGFVYVTGTSVSRFNGLSRDYLTFKFDTAGNQYWYATFNSTGNGDDDAKAIAVDSSGNVYVAGEGRVSGGSVDYCIVKYNPSGIQQWVRFYNGPANGGDYAYDICTDSSGNIYVTGQSSGGATGDDIATIKYNSAGTMMWEQRYNGSGNGFDFASNIELDKTNNVYVSGTANFASNGNDAVIVKYRNDATGTLAWAKNFSAGINGIETVADIKFDQSRTRLYATGHSHFDQNGYSELLLKYDTSGHRYWYRTGFFDGNSEAYGIGLDVDTEENIFRCSRRLFDDGRVHLMASVYDSSGLGDYFRVFDSTYTGEGDYSYDFKNAIKVTDGGNFYIGYGDYDSTVATLMSVAAFKKQDYRLEVSALIQGMYDAASNSMTADTVTAEIRFYLNPQYVVDQSKAVLSQSGQATFYFDELVDYANYYVLLRHRNSIATWSSTGGSFPLGFLSKNFYSSAGNAFGGNQIQVDTSPMRFAIYSGDVNQDGTIDATDLSIIDNDVTNFLSGYVLSDLNGDEFVDASDFAIADNNAYNFISEIFP